MKKLISIVLVLCGLCSLASAQQSRLTFREDSTFRILQITDSHICFRSPKDSIASERTFKRIGETIRSERPDLLEMTGDIVTWGQVEHSWDRLVDSLNTYKVPFILMFGNHDAEGSLSREAIASKVRRSPYCLNVYDRKGEIADSRLDVLGLDGHPAYLLYSLDSHDYSLIKEIDGYGWFSTEQVEWYRKDVASMTKHNGGEVIPSLMFYHIPVPEYDINVFHGFSKIIGREAENPCPQSLNTGMFAAGVESRSLVGMFVGHDHDNDFLHIKDGVALVYGRYTGDDTVYNNLVPGCRVIILKQGVRGFETYIHETTGRISDRAVVLDGQAKEL